MVLTMLNLFYSCGYLVFSFVLRRFFYFPYVKFKAILTKYFPKLCNSHFKSLRLACNLRKMLSYWILTGALP